MSDTVAEQAGDVAKREAPVLVSVLGFISPFFAAEMVCVLSWPGQHSLPLSVLLLVERGPPFPG